MNDWTCDQAADWIDLYAAGEADAPTRAAVGRHLKACPACSESLRQARQVLGLLDQRFQEAERLERLWARLEAAPQRARGPSRSLPTRWWGRAAALAASALVALGLSGWLGPGQPAAPAGLEIAAVMNPLPERFHPRTVGLAPGPADFAAKEADAAPPGAIEAEPVYTLDLGGKSPAEFRDAVRAATGTGRLPPPAVELDLTIGNPGREALPLRFGDDGTALILDLRGPGVLDAPAPNAGPPLAALGAVRLAPGASVTVPVRRLIGGGAGTVRYLYWTEPGEYTLTVTARVRVGADPLAGAREVTATAAPFRLRVAPER